MFRRDGVECARSDAASALRFHRLRFHRGEDTASAPCAHCLRDCVSMRSPGATMASDVVLLAFIDSKLPDSPRNPKLCDFQRLAAVKRPAMLP